MIRSWAEGLDFSFHAPENLNQASEYARRRNQGGLSDFRHAWWLHSRLEKYGVLRRYALLLDWALAEKGYRKLDVVLPHNARIVVFRFGHLGDVLHVLPTLHQIRKQRPDVRIELVTGPWNKGILIDQNGLLDNVHYFTPDVFQFHRGQKVGVLSAAGEKQFIRDLRGSGVDLVFCPSKPHFSELPLIVGLQPSLYIGGEWNLTGLPVDFVLHTRPFDSRHYELDTVADFLPLMGLERKSVMLEYTIAATSISRIDDLLKKENSSGCPVVSVFPGSGWPGKCWPAENFAELINKLAGQSGIFVALGGSPNERELCERVKKMANVPVLNMAGRLSLDESAAMMKRSVLLIGNDSAPIHLAAAIGCPTLSLWGPTFPEKWAPRNGNHEQVVRGGDCAGCTYWHPAATCQGSPPCMNTISVDEVLRAAGKLLQNQFVPV